jgi:hypothetical protein
MGKDLHYLIIKFFKERMDDHSKVEDYEQIKDDNDILYRIVRGGQLPDLTVQLSDSYRYTLHDYYSRPSVLCEGDFILIARPESKFDNEIIEVAKQDRIGIGKIGKFLGALNYKEIWSYQR